MQWVSRKKQLCIQAGKNVTRTPYRSHQRQIKVVLFTQVC
jgi:hypothetical protein